jgi:hypothetical protein
MSLRPDENVLTFKIRFTNLARRISPAPGDSVLSSRYIEAITQQTSSTYDDCVSSASAVGNHGDFPVFSSLLTRLCAQKAARMTTPRDMSVGPSQPDALMTPMELSLYEPLQHYMMTLMESLHESILINRTDAHYSTENRQLPQRLRGGVAARKAPTRTNRSRNDQQRGNQAMRTPSQAALKAPHEKPHDKALTDGVHLNKISTLHVCIGISTVFLLPPACNTVLPGRSMQNVEFNERPHDEATVDEQLRDETTTDERPRDGTTTDEQLSDATTTDEAPPPGPRLTSLCRRQTWRMSKGNAAPILSPSQATNLLTNMADKNGHQPSLLAPAINLLTDIGDVEEESHLLEGHAARLLAPALSYYPTGPRLAGAPGYTSVELSSKAHLAKASKAKQQKIKAMQYYRPCVKAVGANRAKPCLREGNLVSACGRAGRFAAGSHRSGTRVRRP